MKIRNLLLTLLISIAALGCKKDSISDVDAISSTTTTSSIIANQTTEQNSLSANNNYLVQLPTGNPPQSNMAAIYRLFNPWNGKHFMCFYQEALSLVNTPVSPGSGFTEWVYDGIIGYVYLSGGYYPNSGPLQPIYRYYRNTGDHYFSNSSTPPLYYVSEGNLGYMSTTSGILKKPLYSYFKKRGAFDRLYTVDYGELGAGNNDWTLEGIIGYIF